MNNILYWTTYQDYPTFEINNYYFRHDYNSFKNYGEIPSPKEFLIEILKYV